MKQTYKLGDGDSIIATSPLDFVEQLRDGSKFESHCATDEFMKNFAERFYEYTGEELRYSNPTVFLGDLIKLKYVLVM